jgi:aspartate/methionine/tyrosine aminotransferase
MLSALGCRVVELPCGPQTRFQPTTAQLDALDEPPAGLIIASPANPTGTMVLPDELAALVAWCDAHGTRLVSDEIYHGITFGTPADSAWSYGRNSIVVNSFSKYFSMTGWRLGWMLAPSELVRPVDRLTGNFSLCPPAPSQYAAVEAFSPQSYAEVDAHVRRYRANRDLLVEGLAALGIDKLAPADGAFYVYADISHLTDDSMAWCKRLLAETGLAVVPGIDFDPVQGDRFVRLSFAGAMLDMRRALDRLAAWL